MFAGNPGDMARRVSHSAALVSALETTAYWAAQSVLGTPEEINRDEGSYLAIFLVRFSLQMEGME